MPATSPVTLEGVKALGMPGQETREVKLTSVSWSGIPGSRDGQVGQMSLLQPYRLHFSCDLALSPKLGLGLALHCRAAVSADEHLPGRGQSQESVSCLLRVLWKEKSWTSIPGLPCLAAAHQRKANVVPI